MVKKLWQGLIVIIACAIIVFANFNSASAKSTTNDKGCIEFEDKTVCPDQFCTSGSLTCSNDGDRCYCKSSFLDSSNANKHCEIATGSTMMYDYDQKTNQPKVYLFGGIWSHIAKLVRQHYDEKGWKLDSVENFNGNTAIVFKPDPNSKKTFRTTFTRSLIAYTVAKTEFNNTELKPFDILIDVDLPEVARNGATGLASNQRFASVPLNGEKEAVCSITRHVDSSPIIHINKFSAFPQEFQEDPLKSPCLVGTNLFKLLLFGDDKFFIWEKTQAAGIKNLSKNCSDFPWKADTGFFKQLFSDKESFDLNYFLSNLIVNEKMVRKVYFNRKENLFLGQDFNGKDTDAKLKKVEEYCKKCHSNTNTDDLSCIECQKESILDALRKPSNKNKPLFTIIAEGLVKKDRFACDAIDTSLSYTLNKTLPTADEKEKKLNKRLPKGIASICNLLGSSSDRIKCKENALSCYLEDLNEQKDDFNCNSLASNEFATGRWISCPTINTIADAGSDKGSFLDKVFNLDGLAEIFKSPNLHTIWTKSRDLANLSLLLIFIAIVLAQITNFGISNYHIKKMLPRLIMAALAINLSYLIAQLAVDISNILGYGLHQQLANMAKTIPVPPGLTFLSIISGILAGVGTIALLGGIAILLPVGVIIILGIFLVFVLVALRQAMLIVLVVSMPLAIAAGILPKTKNLFDKWLKNFINVLAVYPIIGLAFGAGKLLKNLFINSGRESSLLSIIGFAMPVLTTLSTPMILMSMTRAFGSLGATLSKLSNKARTISTKKVQDSQLQQNLVNLQNRQIKKIKNTHLPIETARRRRKVDQRIMADNNQKRSKYQSIFGSDTELLKAYINDDGEKGSNYLSLSAAQQQAYDQINALGGKNDAFSRIAALDTVAKTGITDFDFIKKITRQAARNGMSQKDIDNQAFGTSVLARSSGNPATSGILSYISKNSSVSTPNYQDLVDETKKVLNKDSLSRFSAKNFASSATVTTHDNPNPSEPLLISAIRSRLEENFTLNKYGVPQVKDHYAYSVGVEFDSLPAIGRRAVAPLLIETAKRFQTQKYGAASSGIATADQALKILGVPRA